MSYEAGTRVIVLTYDGRPAYAGETTADVVTVGRVAVRNDETEETVAVPVSIVRPEKPEPLEPFFVGSMIEASFPGKISMAGSDEYEVTEVVCASEDAETADPFRHDFDIVLADGQIFRVIVTQQMAP
jgi:hypothetical protein